MKRLLVNKAGDQCYVLLDDADFEWASQYNWFTNYDKGYPRRNSRDPLTKKNHRIYLHREIMGAKEGDLIDHINRDILDCQKSNLRYSDKSQNALNSGLWSSNTSGVKGVGYHEGRKQWRAYFGSTHLGWFKDKAGAVSARRDAELRLR